MAECRDRARRPRRGLDIRIPPELELLTIAFIFGSIFLGETHEYYFRFWWWDILLHATSGGLLERLRQFATQEHFVYWHAWNVDDLVVWNNYRTLHSAAGHKKRYNRIMNRTTLLGDATR